MSQECALEAKASDNMQGYIKKTAACIAKEAIISLYLAFVRQSLQHCIQFSALRDKTVWINWASPVEGHEDHQGPEHVL